MICCAACFVGMNGATPPPPQVPSLLGKVKSLCGKECSCPCSCTALPSAPPASCSTQQLQPKTPPPPSFICS